MNNIQNKFLTTSVIPSNIKKAVISNLDRESVIKLGNSSIKGKFWAINTLIEKIATDYTFKDLTSKKLIESHHLLAIIDISKKHLGRESIETLFDMQVSMIPLAMKQEIEQYLENIYQYEEITKYLPNRTELENKELPQGYDLEVLNILQKGTWANFANHNMEDFACQILQLLKNRKITPSTFTTATFYWALRQKFTPEQIKIVPLFVDGKINTEAYGAMKETLKSTSVIVPESDYTEEYLTSMFYKLKNAPLCEQFFFSIPSQELVGLTLNPQEAMKKTITQEIQGAPGINLFTTYHHEGNPCRMIVSFTVLQEFINVYAGKNAVKILPRIKESSLEDIKNNRENGVMDLGIPFLGAPVPNSADEFSAPDFWDFWMHDFYHSLIASEAPQSHRQALIEIAELMGKVNVTDDEEIIRVLGLFIERLIDMEVVLYRPVSKNQIIQSGEEVTDVTKFVLTLESKMLEALNRLIIQNLKEKNQDPQELQGKLNPLLEKLCNCGVMEKFSEECISKMDLLKSIGFTEEMIKEMGEKKLEILKQQSQMMAAQIKQTMQGVEPPFLFMLPLEQQEMVKKSIENTKLMFKELGEEFFTEEAIFKRSVKISFIIQLYEALKNKKK